LSPSLPRGQQGYPHLSKLITPTSQASSVKPFSFLNPVSAGSTPSTFKDLNQELFEKLWFFFPSQVIASLKRDYPLLNNILKSDPATKLNQDGSIDYASANLSRSLTVFFDGLEAKLLDDTSSHPNQTATLLNRIANNDLSALNPLFRDSVFQVEHVHSLQMDSDLQQFQPVPVDTGIFSPNIQQFEIQPIRGDGNCFPRSIATFLLDVSLETASPVSIQTFADQELQALFTGYQASGTSKKQIIEDTMRYLKRKASENFDCNNILFLHQAIAGFNQSSKGKAEEATLLDSLKALVPSKTADLIYQDVIAHQLNLAAWTAAGKQELAEDGTWLSHQDLKPVLSALGVGIAIYSRPYRSEAHWQRHYDLTQHPFVVGLEYVSNSHYNLLKVQPSSGAKTYNLKPYLLP